MKDDIPDNEEFLNTRDFEQSLDGAAEAALTVLSGFSDPNPVAAATVVLFGYDLRMTIRASGDTRTPMFRHALAIRDRIARLLIEAGGKDISPPGQPDESVAVRVQTLPSWPDVPADLRRRILAELGFPPLGVRTAVKRTVATYNAEHLSLDITHCTHCGQKLPVREGA